MAINDMAFTPTNGLRDQTYNPTKPGNEAFIRDIIQDMGDQLRDYINDILKAGYASTTDDNSGSDNIGVTAITDFDGATVQTILESIRAKLKSTTDGSSGADFINSTAISGIDGSTVQSILESLKVYIDLLGENQTNALNAHKSSTDHDGRYYTEQEAQNLLAEKTNLTGNHEGTWQGYSPVQTDPGIQAIVNEHTSQLADIVQIPIVNFTFDDGYSEDDLTYSIFKEFGMVCDFALQADLGKTLNSFAKYRNYQEEGFGVLSHSCNHLDMRLPNAVSSQVADYELIGSYEKLVEYGFDINGFVAPYSSIDISYIDSYLRKTYNYGFNVNQINLPVSDIGHMTKSDDPQLAHRINLYNNGVARVKNAIDNCISGKGFLAIYDHRIGVAGYSTESQLRELLTYVKTKVDAGLLKVMVCNDAFSKFYGLNLKKAKKNTVTNNLATEFNSYIDNVVSPDRSLTMWNVEKNGNELGVSFTTSTVDKDVIGVISIIGSVASEQTILLDKFINLSNYNLKLEKYRTVYFGVDIWNTDIDLTKITVKLAGRFTSELKANPDSGYITKTIYPSTNRRRFYIAITPTDNENYNYAQLMIRFETTSPISSGSIKISKPVIGLGVQELASLNEYGSTIKNYRIRKTLGDSLTFTLTDNTDVKFNPSKTLKLDGFTESDYNDGTLTIKESGMYRISSWLQINGNGARLVPRLFVNGVNEISRDFNPTSAQPQSYGLDVCLFLNIGDTVYFIWKSIGGTISTIQPNPYFYLDVCKVS